MPKLTEFQNITSTITILRKKFCIFALGIVMNKQWHFGIVGFGRIGKRHSQEIQAHPNARLTGVFDINADTVPSDFTNHNNIESFLTDTNAEVIHICTPNASHYELAKMALLHKKHVVIEKPITLFTEHAKELQEIAITQQKHIFCVMQNRYSPVSQWLKSIVEDCILGQIYSVHVNCAWNRDDRYYQPENWHGKLDLDGGPLYTQFSHFVDLLFWLFGPLKVENQVFFNHNHRKNTEFEDSGIFHFQNDQLAQGSFHYTTSVFDKNFKSSIEIIAENGTIEVSGQYMNEIQYCHIRNYQLPELPPSPEPNLYPGYQGSASNHHYVIQNVIDTLEGISQPDTPISEGISVVEIIENVYLKRNLNFF